MPSHFDHDFVAIEPSSGDGRAELELDALLFENAFRLLGDFGIHPRQDTIEVLDDRHLRTEPFPHRSELEPDVTGANHDQTARHLRISERIGAGADPNAVRDDAG